MKRVGYTALLAGLLAAVMVATATAASGTTSEKRVVRVSFVIKTERFQDKPPKYEELPPKNTPTKGDVGLWTGPLKNWVPQFGKTKGTVVGSMKSRVVWRNRTIGVITETAKLPGGTLISTGRVRSDSDKSVLRIIKGTGVYKGATGSVVGKLFAGNEWTKVYAIKLPGPA